MTEQPDKPTGEEGRSEVSIPGEAQAARGVRSGRVGATDLTVRQAEVLRELVPAHSDEPAKWLRPMDVGGNGSNGVSAVLGQLVRKGLAEDTGKSPHMVRGSKRYRATALGIASDAVLFGERRTKAQADAHFKTLLAKHRASKSDPNEIRKAGRG